MCKLEELAKINLPEEMMVHLRAHNCYECKLYQSITGNMRFQIGDPHYE